MENATRERDAIEYVVCRRNEINTLINDAETLSKTIPIDEVVYFLWTVQRYYSDLWRMVTFDKNSSDSIAPNIDVLREFIKDEVIRLRKVYKNRSFGAKGNYVYDVLLKEEKIGF